LGEIVDIARQHKISAAEISAALSETGTGENTGGSNIIRRLLAYIGGIFVFAGVVVYIGMFWEEMNSAARIIITLGSGAVALVLAMLMLRQNELTKAATPLFLVAGWLQPTGMLVAFDELGSGGDPQHALLAATLAMLAQNVLLLPRYPRSVLVFLAVAFGVMSCWNLFDILDMDEELNLLITGASLMLVSYGIDKTRHTVITPFWYFLGSASFLWASFDLLEDTPVHLLYLGITAFMIYVSTLAQSRTLLFCSTLAMMGYLGYFTGQYFVDSIGWPIALVVMGLVMIGLSNLALRINRRYIASGQG
jgi:hypothetical protein